MRLRRSGVQAVMDSGPFRPAPRWWWTPWRRRRSRRMAAELNSRIREQVVDDVTAAMTRQSPLLRAVGYYDRAESADA